ncbi:MAG: VWA domain-containing protein [Vicinamibacterales bacterium]
MRCVRLAVICLLTAGSVYAQSPAPVALDVVVDAGAGGTALGAPDFQVTEAGRAVPVEGVRFVEPSANPLPLAPIATEDEERAAATAADRIVGIYVDEYHLGGGAAFETARQELAAAVRTVLGPRDLVVAMKPLDSVVSIRLWTDRERAARLIEEAQPRRDDLAPRGDFEQDYLTGTPARMHAARARIVVSGVNALAAHLGRFAGRKTLIVLSDAFPDAVGASGTDRGSGGIEGTVRMANRGGVAIYGVRPSPSDAGATSTPAPDSTLDALTRLAGGTTGFTVDGPADLRSAIGRMLAEAGRYYLLTIRPAADAADGRYRSVDVQVRRPGLTARARAGYALKAPEDAVKRAPRGLPEGLRVPRRTSPLIRTWFGQTPDPGGMTEVSFIWEPAPPRPGDRVPREVARIAVRVTTMDGTPIFDGESRQAAGLSVAGGRPYVSFEAAPATLLVRLELFDLAGRLLDSDVRDLAVVGFRGPVAFGTPSVYRARTMRDRRALLERPEAASPAASRQFSRSEHLVVRIPVLAAVGEPEVSIRLMNGFGAPLRLLPVTLTPGRAPVAQVELPLASLASGRYALEFRARSADGAAIERTEFTVTP